MNALVIAALLLVLLAISYRTGWSRSRKLADGTGEHIHSRSVYHGVLVALWTIVPAIFAISLWALFSEAASNAFILSQLPSETAALGQADLSNTLNRIRSIASGFGVIGEPDPAETAAARALQIYQQVSFLAVTGTAALLGLLGLFWARHRIAPRLRARNQVEFAIRLALIACSMVAILTTLGIVLSLLADALRFFSFINPLDFLFGTTWNPRFQSAGTGSAGEYGLLPLLWGTVMISIIAMLVAVPIGLMTAVYLSQYAHKRVRGVVKPVIEVLAGIPTIVYGFFALVTVGPFLAHTGAIAGIDIKATSALTAGVVMGIMIIPFISSLSDDVIAQVPRAMRDGSLGLGATQSETIRKVLLPAALPGIVGAVLLAVSRAIGETMIVVLAAGNSPVLRLNPAEPTSTVTVTIVNQLTGDADFTSPQSLVAFALGLTLFAMTLLLNMLALYIVRKYREQYE